MDTGEVQVSKKDGEEVWDERTTTVKRRGVSVFPGRREGRSVNWTGRGRGGDTEFVFGISLKAISSELLLVSELARDGRARCLRRLNQTMCPRRFWTGNVVGHYCRRDLIIALG